MLLLKKKKTIHTHTPPFEKGPDTEIFCCLCLSNATSKTKLFFQKEYHLHDVEFINK